MSRITAFADQVKADSDAFRRTFPRDEEIVSSVLLAAEDRRGRDHHGIDWISLLRAMVQFPIRGHLRGISTIEQQYARTVFPRRGSVVLCKLRELALVRRATSRVSKEDVWLGYLWRAYFGHQQNGYAQARRALINDDESLDVERAVRIVAFLKYPKPSQSNERWRLRYKQRVKHIRRCIRDSRVQICLSYLGSSGSETSRT